MAISIAKIYAFLDHLEMKYERKDDETVVTGFGDGKGNSVMVLIRLLEDGEFLQFRTLKHLDDLVAEASPEKRVELMKWMLHENYTNKNGAWEYDPADHDHHIAIGHPIEDGDLTFKQFKRMIGVMQKSTECIPEMKKVLGLAVEELDPIERKRQELLAQLRALDSGDGI
jgi:hypothetical protein